MPVAPEHAAGGPFFFAWVDPTETTFNSSHHRYDEYIFSFSLPQREGDFATLSIDIKNPGTGLFAPGRKTWAWFAHDNGGSDVEPLFFGRVVGIPTDLLKQVITVQLTARPDDYAAQKTTVAEILKVLPYYDPVFVDPGQRDNPDVVLQGYSALWHIDRVTHQVTVSDILVGEDGTVEFDGSNALYDNLSVTLESSPQSSVSFDASVTWQQQATGTINMGGRVFDSYTANAIASGWPKAGAGIGGGWSVESASATVSGMLDLPMVNFNINYQNQAKKHRDGDTMSIQESFSGPKGSNASSGITLTSGGTLVIGDPQTGTPGSSSFQRTAAVLGIGGAVSTSLVLRYDANRKREEHIKFTLAADLQPVLHSDDSSESNGPIVINGADVGVPLSEDSGAEIPIGDTSRSSYFTTDRGQSSIQHVLCRARAMLLLAARVGRVSWECGFADALSLSCRKNARLNDPRVAGDVIGKIISYELTGDGDSGVFLGKVTIACAVGKASAIDFDSGSADYIDSDYIEAGYYARSGEVVALPAGDIGYSPPVYETGDDLSFPLSRDQVVVREQVINSFDEQKAAVTSSALSAQVINNPLSIEAIQARAQANIDSMVAALEAFSQKYELELKSVTGTAAPTEFDVETTVLSIPMQIDLSAIGA